MLRALEAAYIKECTDAIAARGDAGLLVRWPLGAVIAWGVVGMVYEWSAWHVGPLRSSPTAIVIVDQIASVELRAWIFGERLGVTWSWSVMALVALGVTLVGAWVLPESTPPTMAAARGVTPR